MFNFNDSDMIAVFKLGNVDVNKEDLKNWLRKKDDPVIKDLKDKELAAFLNGLIIETRGKQDGPQPEPEDRLNNNIILRKLKIALNLKTDDILDLFASINVNLRKHELSAFFRNPNHKAYRSCMDQYLRNFMTALQTKYKNKLGRMLLQDLQ
jgi:uncharacterized protein YehS (DUF1456 family)